MITLRRNLCLESIPKDCGFCFLPRCGNGSVIMVWAILLLFMTTDTAREGLGLSTETAGAIYGLYTAGVYLLTLPGGWIADNIPGQSEFFMRVFVLLL